MRDEREMSWRSVCHVRPSVRNVPKKCPPDSQTPKFMCLYRIGPKGRTEIDFSFFVFWAFLEHTVYTKIWLSTKKIVWKEKHRKRWKHNQIFVSCFGCQIYCRSRCPCAAPSGTAVIKSFEVWRRQHAPLVPCRMCDDPSSYHISATDLDH